MAREYLSPSWKIWATSMPRAPSSGSPHVGAAVARLHRGQVGPLVHLEILAQARAHVVVAILVGTHHPLRDGLQAGSGDDAGALRQPHRAHGALAQAEGDHLLVGQQREAGHKALDLQLVQLVIARNEQTDEVALGVLTRERLHRGRLGDAQKFRQLGDGMHARGGDLLHGAHLVERGAGQTRAGLGIGRVTARAVHEIGLTRFRQRHEFGRHLAADLAAIGLHLAVIQAAAGRRWRRRPSPWRRRFPAATPGWR